MASITPEEYKELPLEKRPRLAICSPVMDHVHKDWCHSMLATVPDLLRHGVPYNTIFSSGSLLLQVRHELVQTALNQGFEYIMMIDSDISFPQNLVREMYSLMLANELDILGLNYPTRNADEPVPTAWRFPTHPSDPQEQDFIPLYCSDERKYKNLVEAAFLPTGFLMVRKEVFEAIEKPWFEFPWFPEGNCYLGEDYMFCDKAHGAGFDLWTHTELSKRLSHWCSTPLTLSHCTIAPTRFNSAPMRSHTVSKSQQRKGESS